MKGCWRLGGGRGSTKELCEGDGHSLYLHCGGHILINICWNSSELFSEVISERVYLLDVNYMLISLTSKKKKNIRQMTPHGVDHVF